MRKCKICEIGNIEGDYYICNYCGWESDPLQEENEDYIGGANEMSFNQYKKFCKDCKNELQLANNSLEAIKLSIEYYKKNFQNQNEEIVMKENIKNIKESTIPPYKCKVCGMGDVNFIHDICMFCGWEDDGLQNEQPDYMGGANHTSLNRYKKFWQENKKEILKADNTCFKAIDLAKKYYEINYKNHKLN